MNRKKLYISIGGFVAVLAVIIIIFILHKKYALDTSTNETDKSSIFEGYDFSDDFEDTDYLYLTESSDYFFLSIEYGPYENIYKISKKTGKPEIICNNPQCTHTDSTCGACMMFPDDGMRLHYYNGRLYYDSNCETNDDLISEQWIMSMDLEGKDRKKEVKINEVISNSESGCGISMSRYGKEIYMSKTYDEVDEDGVSKGIRTEIHRIDLDTNKVTKIYEKSQKGIDSHIISKNSNIVYIEVVCYDNNADIQYTASLVTYDENTGNITEEAIGSYCFLGTLGNDKYFKTQYENEKRILVKKSGSEEYEEIYNMGKENGSAEIFDRFILVYKANESITVLDTEGNFLKEIDTDGASYFDTQVANGLIFLEKKDENNQCEIYICPLATDTNTWTKIS